MNKCDWITEVMVKFIDNMPAYHDTNTKQLMIEMLNLNGIENPELWLLKQILQQQIS